MSELWWAYWPVVLIAVAIGLVTGGEALYADMGHFGRAPIRLAWLGLVFPAHSGLPLANSKNGVPTLAPLLPAM